MLALTAQSNHNGVWYSLYDDSNHTMNTQGDYSTSNIYAPTAGTLNVKWKYSWIDWLGIARKIDTRVLESSDGGSSSRRIGALQENTDDGSITNETFTVSKDINWIKFDRSGVPTHEVIVQHMDIRMAQHILLESGLYGTTLATTEFPATEALTASEAQAIRLRSFLTTGDITISSSLPEIFHIGSADNTQTLVYSVGANACASTNGKAQAASATELGDIRNYAFNIYFTPQEAKDYAGVITITDGTSKAIVSIFGSGTKKNQTISWDPDSLILSSDTIATAEVSSGLPIEYTIVPEGIVEYANGAFSIIGSGTVEITASQAGNEVYNAAEPVSKTITIIPAETRYEYSARTCEGSAYFDDNFQEGLTEAGIYCDTLTNIYGTDSIVCLILTVDTAYSYSEDKTLYVGEEESWENIDLQILPLGDTTLVAEYTTIYGCDSVYTLHLHIVERPTTYGEDTLDICSPETVTYESKTYRRSCTDTVLLSEKNQYGGDSIVILVVNVHPSIKISAEKTIGQGDNVEWQDIDLSELPAGDTILVAEYMTVYGCDSIYTLHLTVQSKVQTDLEKLDPDSNRKAKKLMIGNQVFILRDDKLYTITGQRVK